MPALNLVEDDVMEMYLQFGYGMMDHCRRLVKSWKGGTVILSPRDLERKQLVSLSSEIRALPGGRVLLDPQFYLPRSDHARLTAHDYWPDTYQTNSFFGGPGMATMMDDVLQLNREVGSYAYVLPGLLASAIDDDWLGTLRTIAEHAAKLDAGVPLYSTVALSADSMRNTVGIHEVLAEFETMNVEGAYLLFEHPSGEYIVRDPVWLANAAELAAGLRLMGKHVMVGYANHQFLYLAAASVTAIASGTWLNVRAFSPDRFRAVDEEDHKRKTVWYYDPSSLSEYKPVYLDAAMRAGVLADMAPPQAYGSTYAAELFSGIQPSSVGFGEQEAFRHYLQCVMHQARAARQATFDTTISGLHRQLDSAESQARLLEKYGVLAGTRKFGDGFDPVRSALSSLEATRSAMLRRAW